MNNYAVKFKQIESGEEHLVLVTANSYSEAVSKASEQLDINENCILVYNKVL